MSDQTALLSPEAGAAAGHQLPDTFWLLRRRGATDDDWSVITDPAEVNRHSLVHFEIEPCSPAPLPEDEAERRGREFAEDLADLDAEMETRP